MSADRPSYRTVLRTPHVAPAFGASILGRLSLATSGLALVLLLEQSTGSFAVAGAVTAVLGIANVVATPWRARLIDRRGQRLVLGALSFAHALSLLALGIAADAALPLLLTLSAVAGASAPPFGAAMRVLWSSALPTGRMRTAGFSLDAVAEEVTFAIGPLVAALLAVVVDPFAGLAVAAGAVAVGGALLILSPLSRAQRGSHGKEPDRHPAVSPLRSKGFVPVVAAMTAPGIILGCVEIVAPAVAAAEAVTLFSGILLAMFAAASAVGGLLYGRIHPRIRLERQLLGFALVLLAITAVTGLLGGTVVSVIGFTLGGAFIAPLLIVGYLAADARTDERVRTEASSWISAAVNLGAAGGALVFGLLTDATGPGHALAFTAAAAVVVLVLCAPSLLRAKHQD